MAVTPLGMNRRTGYTRNVQQDVSSLTPALRELAAKAPSILARAVDRDSAKPRDSDLIQHRGDAALAFGLPRNANNRDRPQIRRVEAEA
jgi:hypothetical protein